jgi:hypothetical protein
MWNKIPIRVKRVYWISVNYAKNLLLFKMKHKQKWCMWSKFCLYLWLRRRVKIYIYHLNLVWLNIKKMVWLYIRAGATLKWEGALAHPQLLKFAPIFQYFINLHTLKFTFCTLVYSSISAISYSYTIWTALSYMTASNS